MSPENIFHQVTLYCSQSKSGRNFSTVKSLKGFENLGLVADVIVALRERKKKTAALLTEKNATLSRFGDLWRTRL